MCSKDDSTCRKDDCACGDGYVDPMTGKWVPGDVARAQRAEKEKEQKDKGEVSSRS